MKLYEIVDALQDESKYINAETGEIDVELLSQLNVEYDSKVDSICTIIKELENDDFALSAEIERLKEKREAKKKRIEGLKSYLTFCIPDKWGNARYTVTIRNNQRVDADLDLIPDEYKRTTTKVEADKKRIAERLKCGETIPGATLIVNRTPTIK